MAKTKVKHQKSQFEQYLDNIDWNFVALATASTLSAVILLSINIMYIEKLDLKGSAFLSNVTNILALIIFLVPPMTYRYTKYLQARSIEEKFPLFLRGIVEGLRSGMDLHRAIIYASRSSYGALDPYIKKLVTELSWGIPFNVAINNFAKSLKNPVINRVIATILEAYRSGGNLANVMDAVSQSTFEIEKIKKERSSTIHGQMVQGYVIFVIFLAVMIGMVRFLIPALSGTGDMSGGLAIDSETYKRIFVHLSVIQGFFAGLVIGKLAEGSISAGLRHSIIMSMIAYSVMTLST